MTESQSGSNATPPHADLVELSETTQLRNQTTNQCKRCLRGNLLGVGAERSCVACGWSPTMANEYESAQTYLATLERNAAGEVVLPRDVGLPGERLWND